MSQTDAKPAYRLNEDVEFSNLGRSGRFAGIWWLSVTASPLLMALAYVLGR